ncbi:molybdopterin biosynthesis MoaE protein [Methylocella silvestris BL2]|uniref:Molybdopterin synthase catalytic subunit n=1 Tax=Methylocella silvestris (strain DSM 15510 / CIP 108128 / LMG 27833 / NCIMB 13906 / BL2) TaxID=395965 RepID=B8ESR6_METSB|nr:molybdenum cofactor biosynthesis protein MoaE [Methylocella silvestris]ACK50401.1 molybdopterin biosynthesis MoaE protein [Methylocella silvestris BL2]
MNPRVAQPDVLATVRVEAAAFDVGREMALLTQGRTDVGAVVAFTGLCRDEGGALAALEIEHYPGMAEDEIGRVVAKALERWPLQGALVIHRYGRIAPGEPIVLVITLSRHRSAAFAAAEFLMDYLKTAAPFWKKQHLVGDRPDGGWVAAKAEDDSATARWRLPEGSERD